MKPSSDLVEFVMAAHRTWENVCLRLACLLQMMQMRSQESCIGQAHGRLQSVHGLSGHPASDLYTPNAQRLSTPPLGIPTGPHYVYGVTGC